MSLEREVESIRSTFEAGMRRIGFGDLERVNYCYTNDLVDSIWRGYLMGFAVGVHTAEAKSGELSRGS